MQIKLADVAQRSPEYSGLADGMQRSSDYSGWNTNVKVISRLADVPISRWNAVESRILGMNAGVDGLADGAKFASVEWFGVVSEVNSYCTVFFSLLCL